MIADTEVSRDGQILAHIRRFGLTTPSVLHQLFFTDVTRKAVERVTTRLIQHQRIVSYPLYHPYCYYRLSPAIARRFGLDEEASKPYGSQAILRAYGTLAFCCLGPKLRQKLSSQEFEERFPDCVSTKISSYGYYLDDDGETLRLGQILVDHGADSRRIIRKVHREVRRRMALPAFRNFAKLNRFVIAVVTVTPEKAAIIEKTLSAKKSAVRFRIETIPELSQMTGKPCDPT